MKRENLASGKVEAQDVLPPKQSPLPTKKDEWMAKYVLRLIERGAMDADSAWACCRAGADDHDYDGDPAEAADTEMSYWDDDGDTQP